MEWKIPLADIDFGPEEAAAVANVLRSKWLTMGSVTQEFEQSFAAYVGAVSRFATGDFVDLIQKNDAARLCSEAVGARVAPDSLPVTC